MNDISLFRWVTGLQLFLVGQGLNAAIYRALGKSGVYYGFKIGVPVPWCTGFPFNVFTMHPQYAGVVMSLFGGGVLMMTPQHARGGFGGVGVPCVFVAAPPPPPGGGGRGPPAGSR